MDGRIVLKYISFVDEISLKYSYDDNIKHLLYLIVPAFISKYTIYKERVILNTFSEVRIIASDEVNSLNVAYYTSVPTYKDDNITTSKYIIINNYSGISLIMLLDSLVHEFNHAVNSYQKEVLIKDNILYLRTGLTYASYNIPNMDAIGKDDSYVLEEILNTRQTEEIIDIIKSYHDSDGELSNTIYSINSETDSNYKSESYLLENTLLRPILENKTFLSTLNNLRISGDVENIREWFNNICGSQDSYDKLISYLKEIMILEDKYSKQKLFRNSIISKIKDLVIKIMEIVDMFNNNCNYK